MRSTRLWRAVPTCSLTRSARSSGTSGRTTSTCVRGRSPADQEERRPGRAAGGGPLEARIPDRRRWTAPRDFATLPLIDYIDTLLNRLNAKAKSKRECGRIAKRKAQGKKPKPCYRGYRLVVAQQGPTSNSSATSTMTRARTTGRAISAPAPAATRIHRAQAATDPMTGSWQRRHRPKRPRAAGGRVLGRD